MASSKAVDLLSYVKNDGCYYIIKYMGIDVETSAALSDFKSFLNNFSLKSTESSVKKPERAGVCKHIDTWG